MTSIEGSPKGPIAANLSSGRALVPGRSVIASVLGATRRGVSVLIDAERFDLKGPAKLAEAATLTLRVASQALPSAKQVDVVGVDGRSLSSPIKAELIAKPAPPAAASTIVERGRIDVIARPMTSGGETPGPGIVLRLQAPTQQTPASNPPASIPPSTSSSPDLAVRPQSATQVLRPAGEGERRFDPSRPAIPPSARHASVSHTATSTPPGSTIVTVASTTAHTPGPPLPTSESDLTPQRSPENPARKGLEHLSTQNAGQPLTGTIAGRPAKAASVPFPFTDHQRSADRAVPDGGGAPPHRTSSDPSAAGERKGGITATVVARDANGQVIIRAAERLFKVEQPLDLPLDTRLQIVFPASMPASAQSANAVPTGDMAAPLAELIELLEDIDRATRFADSADRSSAPRQLPEADRHLAQRFLALLAAAGDESFGDVERRSHEKIGQTGTQGDRIASLLRDIGGQTSEPLADGWKGQMLPLGSDAAQAVFLYHRDHDLDTDGGHGGPEPEGEEAKRAVFDLSLSRLGRCQIDALCQGQRFDLIIRSEQAFGVDDRRNIASIFVSALDIAGMNGEIGFKVGQFFDPPRLSNAATDLKT